MHFAVYNKTEISDIHTAQIFCKLAQKRVVTKYYLLCNTSFCPFFANILRSALCQHIVDFVYFITWDEAKILDMEAKYTVNVAQRRVFFINQRAASVNVLNRIDGTNMPVVYGMLMD